jgi:hypothetical protein
MNDPINLLSLEVIKQRCSEESERFRRQQDFDPAYCFEMLRRALVLADEQAWTYVYLQYAEQVASWVQIHPVYHRCDEEAAYFVNGAFSRFSQAITPAKFKQLKGLNETLQYLKLCVGSTIWDHLRSHAPGETVALDLWAELVDNERVENSVEKRQYTQQLWQKIDSHLKSSEEKLLMESIFVFGMKPSAVVQRYPHIFPDTKRVYRMLENILKRLRRDPELRDWFDQGDN